MSDKTVFIKMISIWFIFIVCANLAFGWVVGSAITSGIKAATNDCGTNYVAERFFQGNWFCDEEECKSGY